MSIHVVTVANKSDGYYKILKQSCILNGCKLTTLGFGEKWGGFVWKYTQMQKFLKTVDPTDIVIFVDGVQVNQFNIGDEAEYGSYNLIYTGPITKITDKMVQITAYPGTRNETRHNLSLGTFCWRNEKFDAVKTAKYNQEEMYYI